MKKLFIGFCASIVVILIICIGFNNDEEEIVFSGFDGITVNVVDYETDYVQLIINEVDYVLIELYPDEAPVTVENFKSLVSSGYYDGLVFHRIIEDFMIQGGSGDEVDSIIGEFSLNGYENDIEHLTGTLSMARTSEYDSATSQFFICLNDTGCAHLDGSYAAFGSVIAGMESVIKVSQVETDSSDYPIEKQVITSISFVEIEEY